MTLEQAMKNIEQALAATNGNLQLHMALQESLQVLKKALQPQAPEAAAPVEAPKAE